MARTPVIAAGGIVMRREQPPLIAVVRPRKRDEWVLPKGKLDDGETPRAAARREVLEETGHSVTVHEFLGTLVYESGGRHKVVHYWRMEAGGSQACELMSDIRAVDWLPLEDAIARLSRISERAFLENVGPLAVSALSRRLKAKAPGPAAKTPVAKKRRVKVPAVTPPLPPSGPLPEAPMQAGLGVEPAPEPVASEVVTEAPIETAVPGAATLVEEAEFIPQPDMAEPQADGPEDDAAPVASAETGDTSPECGPERQSLAQKVRNWLGRAA